MTEDKIPPEPSVEAASPRAQVAGLIDDVKALARAEMDYARARLQYSSVIAKRAGIYALLALFLLGSACIALVLGILLVIESYWGPWIATLVTTLLFAGLALALALRAQSIAKQLDLKGDRDA